MLLPSLHYQINEMSNKSARWLVGAAIVVIPLIIFLIMTVSTKNKEIGLRNKFTAKKSERVASYDKIWKTITGKAKVAVKNDSSFQNIVRIQMQGQKDGEAVTWKWIQQSNPAATFTEVSALYKDLSRAIEATREEFFQQEKVLQSIKLEHDNLLAKWPSSMFVGKRKPLEYVPITSDRTDDVFKTGKDNNVEVFE